MNDGTKVRITQLSLMVGIILAVTGYMLMIQYNGLSLIVLPVGTGMTWFAVATAVYRRLKQ